MATWCSPGNFIKLTMLKILRLECDATHFDKFINSVISNRTLRPNCDMKVNTLKNTLNSGIYHVLSHIFLI